MTKFLNKKYKDIRICLYFTSLKRCLEIKKLEIQ